MTTQTKRLRVSTILKALNCPKMDLANGGGYWYFIYDDVESNVYETHSVMTVHLNDLTLEMWLEEGRELINKVKGC